MVDGRPGCVSRSRRRWAFADCLFDEVNWTLVVAGRRVAIETKPLELLRQLLIHSGELVSKADLLDSIWPDVTVVEASLPTAVRKLRVALGDDRRDPALIETVSGIGYRLTVRATVEEMAEPPVAGSAGQAASAGAAARRVPRPRRWWAIAGLGAAAIGLAVASGTIGTPPGIAPNFTSDQRAQLSAMRRLDLPAVERMIANGWDPNAVYDREGTNALQWLLNICEWNPGHDRRQLLLVARTLIDGGADLTHRNVFGDTAYSIAKADRYCGPDHPVTEMFRRLCRSDDPAYRHRCVATYALSRGERL